MCDAVVLDPKTGSSDPSLSQDTKRGRPPAPRRFVEDPIDGSVGLLFLLRLRGPVRVVAGLQ